MALLHEITTREAEESFDDVEVAILPIGSTEQHGPAMPLGTDFLAAEAVARSAADREDAVVLPTVPIGISSHHRQFYGTLWVPPDVFEDYIRHALSSLADHGVRKGVVVNGHGGNVAAMTRVAKALNQDGTAFYVPWSWWEGAGEAAREVLGEDAQVPGHAGAFETSMVMHLAPELVREDALEDAEEQGEPRWTGAEAPGGFDLIDRTETGALGRPTMATEDAGEALLEASSGALDALLDWLAERPFEDLRPRGHR